MTKIYLESGGGGAANVRKGTGKLVFSKVAESVAKFKLGKSLRHVASKMLEKPLYSG